MTVASGTICMCFFFCDKSVIKIGNCMHLKTACLFYKDVVYISWLMYFLLCVYFKAGMEVDLMCGDSDPANFTLPQQPLHRCMFPQAMMYPTMQSVSNPYECTVDGFRYSACMVLICFKNGSCKIFDCNSILLNNALLHHFTLTPHQ